jgi:hypothetical protein
MVKVDKTVVPGSHLVGAYEQGYREFVSALRNKGYIKKENYA